MDQERRPVRFDYNDDDFRHGAEEHALDGSILLPDFRDVHPYIADRLAALRVARARHGLRTNPVGDPSR